MLRMPVGVEEQLHLGNLKAVVCTSSLDLGVDFRPVETVIQIGSPKGVARFLQRGGRSGHQPGATSRIYFLPTNSLELTEGAALREAMNRGIIEERIPYIRSFDVPKILDAIEASDSMYRSSNPVAGAGLARPQACEVDVRVDAPTSVEQPL